MEKTIVIGIVCLLLGVSAGVMFTGNDEPSAPTSCQDWKKEKENLKFQIDELEAERQRLLEIGDKTPGQIARLQELTDRMMNLFFTYVGIRLKGGGVVKDLVQEQEQDAKECPESNTGLCPECPEKEALARLENRFRHYRQEMEEKLEKESGKKKDSTENLDSPDTILKRPLDFLKSSKLLKNKNNPAFEKIQGNYEGYLEHVDQEEQGTWKVEAGMDFKMTEEGYAGNAFITLIDKNGTAFSRSRGNGDNRSWHGNERDNNGFVVEASPNTFFRLVPEFGQDGIVRLQGTAYKVSHISKEYEYIGKVFLNKISN